MDESAFTAKWEEQGRKGESEHQIYHDETTGRWWKRNTLNFHDGSISAYLERLAAQKALFPETETRFEGFTTFAGEIMPVISQADAVGEPATDAHILAYLETLGFVEVFETGKISKMHQLAIEAGLNPPPLEAPKRAGFLLPEEGIWLEDVHEENAVVSPGTSRFSTPCSISWTRANCRASQSGRRRSPLRGKNRRKR